MGVREWMRGVLAARKRRARRRTSRHCRDKLLPGLFVRELEDRRVLSVGSLVWASAAGELFLDAGAGANDGVADAFLLTRQGDQLQVSVDGQVAYAADMDGISSIHVNGSSDADTLTVDFSNGDPLPFGGLIFEAGGAVQGADSLVVQRGSLDGVIETVTHRFERIDDGRISLSFSSDSQPNLTSTIAFTGLASSDHARANVTILGGEDDTVRLSGPIDLLGASLYVAAGAIEVDGTITSPAGSVRLDAGGDGTLLVSGTIDVSAAATGQTGGTVHLLGKQVGLTGSARIDASGDAGGGKILVGGDFQGSNPLIRNATATYVGSEVTLAAAALSHGNGGTIVVWSDGVSRVYGTLSARGGALSGDGGLVETSGHQLLLATTPDVSAPAGRAGNWLLDPEDVSITNLDANITSSGTGDPGPVIFSPTAADTTTTLSAATIITALNAGSNVTVQTTSFGTATLGRITIDAAITKTADGGSADGSTLTLTAADAIVLNQVISSSTGLLNVVLQGTSITETVSGDAFSGGTLTIQGNLSPGLNGTGTFDANGSVTFDASSRFLVNLNGTSFDQLLVNGAGRTVTLGGARLVLTLNSVPPPGSGQSFKIVDTTGATPTLNGVFQNSDGTADLNDGDKFTVGSTVFRINYTGGDVVLTEANAAPTLTAFTAVVETTAEDTQVEITFAELAAQGNEADVDGTVTAFVVQSVGSGTLKIGTSAGSATPFAVGTNDTLDATNKAFWAPGQDANGTLDAFAVVARDDGGAISTTPVTAQVSVTAVNDPPTLASFTAVVDTTAEDTPVEITFTDLAAQGDEADVDGTVTAFVVQSVSSGTLKIGTDAGSATAFAPGSNDTIDATGKAIWTPDQDANGTLDAFAVVARDDGGAISTTPVTAQVSVTAVNDPPTLASFTAVVDTTAEDTPVEITFTDLAAQGDEADVDGTVTAFVVQSVSSGTLKIGTDAGSATAFAPGSNDTIDATGKAIWTPDQDANGTLDAFAVVARDDGGAISTTPVTAQVSVTAVNDPPTLASFTAVVDTTAEDTPVEITFTDLAAQGDEADVDGTVTAFVVQSVSSGTLKIGTDAGSATAFAPGSNDTIDATGKAIWTPDQDANGTLDAFAVVARDDGGAISTTPVTAQVSVTAVNDPPTLASFTAVVDTTAEDTPVEITFTDLAAQGDEADVDGTVTAFVVQSVSSGTLKIGTDAGSATAFAPGSNDTIDATGKAIWTPDQDANGTLDAFAVVARDDGGAVSTTLVTAQVSVAAVNDPPEVDLNASTAGNDTVLSVLAGVGPTVIAPQATVSDVDSTSFNTGSLTVTVTNGVAGEDVLSIRNQGSGLGEIGFSGGNVTFGGTLIGTATGGVGATPLVVSLNGSATPDAVQALAANVTYENTKAANPTTTARSIRFVVNDGADDSTARTATVSIAQPDTTIAVSANNLTVTDANTATDDALTVRIVGSVVEIRDPGRVLVSDVAGATGSGTDTVTVLLSSFTGSIVLNTGSSNDSVTLDFSGGDFSRAVSFNGGAGTDTIRLTGGTFASQTFSMTDNDTGSVTLTGNATLSFDLTEVVDSALTATTTTVNFSTVAETVSVSAAAAAGRTTVDSGQSPAVMFDNPTGTLALNAGGTNNDTIAVSGVGSGFQANLTLDGQGGTDSVTISGAINIGSGTLTVSAENVNFNAATTAQSLTVTGNTVSQTAALAVSGTATFSVGSNALTLTNAGNEFGGTVNVTAGAAELTDAGGVQLGTVSATSLIVTAGGAITDVAGSSVSVTNNARFNAGSNAITLGAGTATNFGSLTFVGGAVAIRETSDLQLIGTNSAASLTLTAAGNITDDANADLSVTGTARFTADNAGNTAAITLGDAAGNTMNFGSLTVVSDAATTITESSATEFTGSSSTGGGLTLVSAGDITDDANAEVRVTGTASFRADNAGNTAGIILGDAVGNTVNFGSLTVVSDADTTITENSASTFTGSSTVGGSLTLVSAGDITDDGDADLSVTGTASFRADNPADTAAIVLGDATGNTVNFGSLTVVSDADATITEGSATAFTGSSVVGGNLTLTSAGDITDDADADLEVTGTASFRADNGPDTAAITLGDAAGNTVHFGKLTVVSEAAAAITEDSATEFTGSSVVDGDLTLVSAGDISDDTDADLSVSGTAGFRADNAADSAAITLGDAAGNTLNFGNLTVISDADTSIAEDSSTGFTGSSTVGGNLTLRSAGHTTDDANADLSVTGIAHLTAINTADTADITLGDAAGNTVNFGSLSVISDDNTTITEDSATEFTGSSSVGGNLTLTSSGGIGNAAGASLSVTGTASFTGTAIRLGKESGDNLQFGLLTFSSAGLVEIEENSATVLTGTIAPGTNGGVHTARLGTVDVGFGANAAVALQINGTGPGTTYDQIDATGTVTINSNATLTISGSYTPQAADGDFILIRNDGTDDVIGSYKNLAEGTKVTLNGVNLYITYTGGDGNDVALTQQLVIRGSSGADRFELTGNGTAFQVVINGSRTINLQSPPRIDVDGLGGDDLLIVMFSATSTDPIPLGGVFFDGGTQTRATTSPTPGNTSVGLNVGDGLAILGSGVEHVTYAPSATTFGDGLVFIGKGTAQERVITFMDLEPVDVFGVASVALNLPGAADVINVSNGTSIADSAKAALVVSGSTGGVSFEELHLGEIGVVTIDTTAGGSDGDDQVNLIRADNPHFVRRLEILTGTGADTVTIQGPVTLAGDGGALADVSIVSQNILFQGGAARITVGGGQVILDSASPITRHTVAVVAAHLDVRSPGPIDLETQVAAVTFHSNSSVRLDNTGGLELRGTNAADSLTLNTTGAITNAASASVTVTQNAAVNGASIALGDQTGDVFQFGSLTFQSGGTVRIEEDGNLLIAGINSADSLVLLAGGTLTNLAAARLTVAGNARFGGSSVTLGDQTSDWLQFGSLSFTSAGAVYVEEDDAVQLGEASSADSLLIRTDGLITNAAAAAVTVAGQARFLGSAITLGDQSLDSLQFGSLSFAAAGAVHIAEDNDTQLTGASSADSLVLGSTGALTNAASATLAVTGNARFAGASVTLGNQAGDSLNIGTLSFAASGAVEIHADSKAELAGTSQAGSLTLESPDAISNSAGASVTVSGLAVLNGWEINLGNQLGDFLRSDRLTFTANQPVDIAVDTDLQLAGTSSAAAVMLKSTGNIGSGAAPADIDTSVSGGSLTLEAASLGAGSNPVELRPGAGAVNLSAASGSIYADWAQGDLHTAGLTLSAAGAGVTIQLSTTDGVVFADGTGNFDANTQDDLFVLKSGGGKDIAFGNGPATWHMAGLRAEAGGAITEPSAARLAVTGNASFQGATIALGEQPGDLLQFGSLTFNSAGSVMIDQDSGTRLAGSNTAVSLRLVSAAAIDDEAGADLTVDGEARFQGTTITLGDDAGNEVHFGSLIVIGGTVAVSEDSATELAGASAGSLWLTSNGTITDVNGAAIDVAGLATLDAGSNAITLGDHVSDTTNFGRLRVTGGAVAVREDSDTVLAGVSAASLTLTSNGPITDVDGTAIDVANLAMLNAGNNAITLGDQVADSTHFGSLNLTGGAVTVVEDSATVLAGVSASSLALTSNGPITDADGTTVDVTGLATLDANNNAIMLGDHVSDDTHFGGLNVTGDAVAVSTDGAIVLAGVSATSLALTSNGSITDVAGATIGVTGLATLDAGNSAITLGDQVSDTTHFGSLKFTSSAAVSIAEDSDMQLAGTSSAAEVLLKSTGNIGSGVDAADIDTSLFGGKITLEAASLGTSGNPVALRPGAGAVSLAAASGSIYADWAQGDLHTAGLTLSATGTGVTIQLSTTDGVLFADGTASSAANTQNDLFVLQSGGGKDIAFGNGPATWVMAGLRAEAGGAIIEPSAANLAVTGNASFQGAAITLGGQAGDFLQFDSLTFNSAGSVTIEADNATRLAGNNTASSLRLASAVAIVDEAGADLTVDGQARFDGANITLGDEADNDVHFGSLFVMGNTVAVTEDSETVLAGVSAGALSLISNGPITDADGAVIDVAGLATLNAGNNAITLGDQAGDITNFGRLNVTGGVVTVREDSETVLAAVSAGSLSLASSGPITDANGAAVDVAGLATLNAGNNAITLGDQAADSIRFGSLNLTGGEVSIVEQNGMVLSGANTGSSVDLRAGGDLVFEAAAALTVDSVTFRAGVHAVRMGLGSQLISAGDVTVLADGMQFAGTLQSGTQVRLSPHTGTTAIHLGADAEASGGLALTDTELNTIAAPVVRIGYGQAPIAFTGGWTADSDFAADFLELRTDGSVTGTKGAIRLSGNLAVRSAGAVDLGAAAHDFKTVAVSTGGTDSAVTLRDAVGSITVGSVDGLSGISTGHAAVAITTLAGDIVLNDGITATDGTVHLNSAGGIVDNHAGGLDVQAGSLLLNASAGVAADGAALATQVGHMEAAVGPAGLFVANVGDLVIGDVDPDTSGVSAAGGKVNLSTTGTLTILEGVTSGGNLTLQSDVQITLEAALRTAGGNVTLNAPVQLAGNRTPVLVDSGGGNILFTASMDGVTTGANSLVVSAGAGRVTFAKNVGATTPLGGLTIIDAGDVDLPAVRAAALVQQSGAGATTLNGPVTVSGPLGVELVTQSINVNANMTASAGGLTFTNAQTLTIANDTNLVASGAVLQNGAGPVRLGGNIRTVNGAVTFSGPLTLLQSVSVDTSAGGKSIWFRQAIDGTMPGLDNLTLAAGAGDITLDGAVGTSTRPGISTRLGAFVLTGARTWTPAAITVASWTQHGPVTLRSDLSVDASAGVVLAGTLDSESGQPQRLQIIAGPLGVIFLGSVGDAPGGLGVLREIDIQTEGVLAIVDGVLLRTSAGAVSNVPPRLSIVEQFPGKPLGEDGVQLLVGTIGGTGAPGDNMELGQNLVLTVSWGDEPPAGRTVDAGDQVVFVTDNNRTRTWTVTPGSGSGPAEMILALAYSPFYIFEQASQNAGVIEATITVTNHPSIRLFGRPSAGAAPQDLGAASTNLNTATVTIVTRLPLNPVMFPPEPPAFAPPREALPLNFSRPAQEIRNTPPQITRSEEVRPREEVTVDTARELLIVKVNPDGSDGPAHQLPPTTLADLKLMFERLVEEGLPDGRYRIYVREAGFPMRILIDFNKSGTSIGDPVREPGPGSNPTSPIQDNGTAATAVETQPSTPALAGVAVAGGYAVATRGRWSAIRNRAVKDSETRRFSPGARWRRRFE